MNPTPYTSFLRFASIFVTSVASAVMLGWIFGYEPILSLIPGAATMKANTALCFIFLGISGIWFHRLPTLSKILASLSAVIAVLSLLEYLLQIQLSLDYLIIEDSYSSITRNRMSPATAICFTLISCGLLLVKENKKRALLVAQNLWLAVIIISFISLVTFLLNIPAEEKTSLFSSMAIHTTILFSVLSIGLFYQTSDVGFASLITSQLPGSKIIRQLLPFIILVPVALSYIFFVLSINSNITIQGNFWLIIDTITLTLLSIFYISILAIGLNKSALKEEQLQSSLKASNKSLGAFKQAIDKISIVSIIDTQGNFLEVNKNFTVTTGYQPNEIIGESYASILNDEKQVQGIMRELKKNDLWEGELECKTKEQKNYWVRSTILKSNLVEGQATRYLIIEQDITASKEVEQARNAQFVQRLKQKNQELEQFLYITSHDLQEPLRSIKGMIELLKMEMAGQLNDTTSNFFQLIESSATRMSDLIKGLMDYARIGGKKELVNTDMNRVLEEVLFDLKDRLERNNARVITGPMPVLNVYPVEIRLLFQNLIGNAIKFKKPEADPLVEVNVVEEEGFWRFQVKDNGIGIKESQKEKVFVIFQRLHKKDEFEGTGIGLAHCKKIVTLHGGEIWVESSLDMGSSFFFTLPKQQYSIT